MAYLELRRAVKEHLEEVGVEKAALALCSIFYALVLEIKNKKPVKIEEEEE